MTRTEKYIARVQDRLWWLHGEAARFDFITSELAKWSERRDAFIRKVDGGGDPGDVCIEDYVCTLQELEILQSKYSPLKRIDTKDLDANVARLNETVGAM